jgi:phage shock protein A
MKVFNALKNWLRKKDSEVASAIQDPVAEGTFAIEDSEKQVSQFRTAIANALASNKSLERQALEASGQVTKWGRIAQAAVDADDDEDARKALETKQQNEKRAASLQAEISKNNAVITQQRKLLANAETKIANAKSNKDILTARFQGAKARQGLVNASSGIGGNSPLAALDELERRVNQEETQAEAMEDLAGVGTPSLEEKYSGDNGSVDAELARLRANRVQQPA